MKKLDEALGQVRSVAIAGHVRPDGDCVGSCLATYNYIKDNYPDIQVDLYLEPIPNIFKFLARADEILHSCEPRAPYDVFIAQDCGDEGRLGDAAQYFRQAKKTICIDHHISNRSFADENYIFPDTSSTSELIYELLDEERITKEIAECIYVGIIHDTGVFQYSSTSAKTMNVAGKLMEKGIPFTEIIDKTFYTKTFQQNRILGQALLQAERKLGNAVIVSVVTKEQMEQFDVLPKHLDGIVSQLRATKDVELALFLYETDDGYKVSMRSNGRVDVSKIAMKFGGGGHVRAAGVSMKGSAEEITALILDETRQQLPECGTRQ